MIGFINIATETGIQNENDYIFFSIISALPWQKY